MIAHTLACAWGFTSDGCPAPHTSCEGASVLSTPGTKRYALRPETRPCGYYATRKAVS